MFKSKIFKLLVLFLLAGSFLIFLNFGLGQDKGQGKAKPPDKGGKPDSCNVKDTPPLFLENVQVATSSNYIYQLKYTSTGYENSWASNKLNSATRAVNIGDADNDGMKEIITTAAYRTGKGKNTPSSQKILMYENGSMGDPDYLGPDVGSTHVMDSIIADADGDGLNELVLARLHHAEVYRWIDQGYVKVWDSRTYDSYVYGVDVGDADNDGTNEIVLSVFQVGGPTILEYIGNDTWGNEQTGESVGISGLDYTKVRDADNDGLNELVAGGNNSTLMIWEYNPVTSAYDNIFISYDLGGFTQGVDAGDIDGDGLNEIVVGTTGDNPMIYILKYDSGTWVDVGSISLAEDGCTQLSVGDLDGDGMDEIAVGRENYGIRIIEYVNQELTITFFFPCGGFLEIG